MSTPDDVLGWIRPPLEEMKQDYDANPGKPWEERRESFLGQLGLHDPSQNPVVQELLERLDEAPEEERNRILGSDELDSMADELARQHAAVQAAGGDEAAYDEQAWAAYLAENGPQWDGTEESWEQFRQWFAYCAGQQGLGAPATALLDYLAAQPAAERITTFAHYGVTIPTQQEAAGGDGAAYDEQAWAAYLAENGPQWDGTEESWEQFRQWFAYCAGQQGLGAPATALLDYLAAQPAAERITTFAHYGVTITLSQEAVSQEPTAAEQGGQETAQPTVAELSEEDIESLMTDALTEQDGQETPQPTVAELSDEDIDSMMGGPIKEHPEFAHMPEDERTRILSEVLDELEAG